MSYKVGDRVIYGQTGIMEIVDICEESISADIKSYYVMRELDNSSGTKTYVPRDNERLVSLIHPLLTKEEIFDVLANYPYTEEVKWEENNRVRSEQYKKIMESGDRTAMLAMIRAIEKMGERRAALGKKNYISDDTALRRAEKLINSEISLVMSIPLDEVPSFIEKNRK